MHFGQDSVLLLGFGQRTKSRPRLVEDTRKQCRAHEHQASRHPVVGSERILEVEDGEEETDELAQGDYEGDQQGGTFSRQDEHARDADESGGKWSSVHGHCTCACMGANVT